MAQNPPEDKGRRSFLNLMLGGGLATFMAAVVYPAVRYISPPEVEQSGTDSVSAGSRSEWPLNSGKIVKFGNQPALVLRDADGQFRAFIAVCTHLQCTVQYLPEDRVIWCACHNGKYDLNGINVSGPPPRPLTPLAVNLREEQVFISREA